MILIIFFLTIAIFGTATYMYLHQEQAKAIPEDKYDEAKQLSNLNFRRRRSQSDLYPYLQLIGLSIISGLLIASVILFTLFFLTWELGVFFVIGILNIVQYILVIPATFAVYKIDSWMSSGINPFIRASIPLMFNVLGATSLIIVPSTWDFFYNYHHRDVAVTIINGTYFIRNQTDVNYEVVLNVNNPSQTDIKNVDFYLVTDAGKDGKHFADIVGDFLGSNDRNTFPAGESTISIEVSIYVNDNYPQCKDGSLEKPLYLLYSIGNTYKALEVSNDLNKKILETVCDPVYRQNHGMR